MSAAEKNQPGFGAALHSLLYMRAQELVTGKSLLRMGAIAFGVVALLTAVSDDGESGAFWSLSVGAFCLKFLPIYCLTKGGETLRGEFKDGTIEYLWTRSVGKVQLYFAFYASAVVTVASTVVPVLIGLSVASVILGGVASMSQLLVLWLSVLGGMVSFTAIASLFSAYSSKFVVIGIFYFSFVEMGLGALATGVRSVAVTAHMSDAVELARDGYIAAAYGQLGTGLVGMAVITVVALTLGAMVFSQAHYVVGGEKEA